MLPSTRLTPLGMGADSLKSEEMRHNREAPGTTAHLRDR